MWDSKYYQYDTMYTAFYIHFFSAFSMITLGLYTICFLKLVSYVAVNKWCRQSYSPKKRGLRRTKSVSSPDGRKFTQFVRGVDKREYLVMFTNYSLNLLNTYAVSPCLKCIDKG